MRFAAGLCTAGLFIVCESLLSAASSNRNRGRMLSLYMIVTYGSLGAGQLLLNVTDTSGFARFIIVSSLLSLALVPLILLPAEAPSIEGARSVGVEEIWKTSPLAVIGALAAGLAQKCLFRHGNGIRPHPRLAARLHLADDGVSAHRGDFFAVSNRRDFRSLRPAHHYHAAQRTCGMHCLCHFIHLGFTPILFIALITAYGTVSLPVYSLVIAHANDHLQKEQVLGGSAKLIMLYGLGSMLGPITAGQAMRHIGGVGFLVLMIAVYSGLAGFALWRRIQRPEDRRGRGSEALQVSPVTTPSGAASLGE